MIAWSRVSLTARLAALFALVAALSLMSAGAYLYQSLTTQLEKRDDAELSGKIELVRHLLLEMSSTAMIRQDPHAFLDAVVGHEGLVLVLQSVAGEVLLRNSDPPEALPNLTPIAPDRRPLSSDIQSWTNASGEGGRVVAAWGRVSSAGGEEVRITVARYASDRMALLAIYRRDVILAVLGSTIAAAVLGHAVVRRGLKPVRAIAANARQISAQHLDARPRLTDAPAELRELADAFNDMLDRVQDGVERLSRLSSDMAHDLRTPISNLLGATQVALTHPRSTEEYQVLLESNVEELERLTRMIENMLFLARADNAQVAMHIEPIDAANEIGRITEYFDGIAAEAQVTLDTKASGTIWADPMLIRRAISNLIANAIQHSAPGTQVSVVTEDLGTAFEIIVTNLGAGIAPEHQARIFDRFYRADHARTDSSSASGLGLAIVRSIMLLHRGSVSLESSVGAGAVFRLVFPSHSPSQSRGRPSSAGLGL